MGLGSNSINSNRYMAVGEMMEISHKTVAPQHNVHPPIEMGDGPSGLLPRPIAPQEEVFSVLEGFP